MASAIQDDLKTIKRFTNNTCLQLVMTKETTIVRLNDRASNYWFIVVHVVKGSTEIIKILNWHHLGKKFKERDNKIAMALIEQYNSAKYLLWHGKSQATIEQAIKLKYNLMDESAIKKVDKLIFINNIIKYIVNYQQCQYNDLPFTVQLVESSINSIIKERQKNKKRHSIKSADHDLLQIKIYIFNKRFDDDAIAEKMYKEVA